MYWIENEEVDGGRLWGSRRKTPACFPPSCSRTFATPKFSIFQDLLPIRFLGSGCGRHTKRIELVAQVPRPGGHHTAWGDGGADFLRVRFCLPRSADADPILPFTVYINTLFTPLPFSRLISLSHGRVTDSHGDKTSISVS